MSFVQEMSGNKLKSVLLTFFFFLFIVALVWIIASVMGWGAFAVGIALVLSILMSVGSYYYSDKIVLKLSGAREATHEEYRLLDNLIAGLSIAAGIPKPKIFVIEDTAPNAFATGRNPEHGVICITTGLLQKLDRSELEGVLAHEMSHIKNYDIRFMALISIMVGFVVLLSDFFLRSMFWGGSNREGKGGGSVILLVVGILFIVLAPLVGTLIQLAVSRRREYLADASGVALTRYPEGLAKALEKISKDTEPLEAANKATAHLYIADPLKNNKMWLKGLFNTHPPVADRIRILRSM
ncbi:MAG: M48 family metallopeptidase [Candidatus Micrarchaeota archaeon]